MTARPRDQLDDVSSSCPRREVLIERLVLLHVVLMPVDDEVDAVVRQQLPHIALVGVDRRVARDGGYVEERNDAGGHVRSCQDTLGEVVLGMSDRHVLTGVQVQGQDATPRERGVQRVTVPVVHPGRDVDLLMVPQRRLGRIGGRTPERSLSRVVDVRHTVVVQVLRERPRLVDVAEEQEQRRVDRSDPVRHRVRSDLVRWSVADRKDVRVTGAGPRCRQIARPVVRVVLEVGRVAVAERDGDHDGRRTDRALLQRQGA